MAPFTPMMTWKIKIKKKKNEKNNWRYYHFTHMYDKWRWYDVWFLRYGARQTELFLILNYFLPFYPLTTRNIKILKKWKKTPIDIIILQMCTINEDHTLVNVADVDSIQIRPLKINHSFIIFCPHHNFFVNNITFCLIICHHW